ncbi:PTS sugar transporter subunit IIA [Clostridium sp. D2Q-14]|uniref:PTS sugar transporter subunit IIA n=1 Tax=Anaeromonas gelatinilytica TaxID=2683194 RepID=UPI00193B40B2|nr:PTS sugar transporter subunit IIA [Anaeromonas gelatinilytica]MBS4535584.1 PTS sugar transporter subunit IIA [Anaeromonas gelatinilytica]
MRQYLLASHGSLSEGLLDSVEMILGKNHKISTISAYKKGDYDLNEQLKSVISNIDKDDELIIISDIFGGSVNNECMKLLADDRVHLISGMNLSLVIELFTLDNDKISTSDLIKKALKDSKESILYCNNIINEEIEDEEF